MLVLGKHNLTLLMPGFLNGALIYMRPIYMRPDLFMRPMRPCALIYIRGDGSIYTFKTL